MDMVWVLFWGGLVLFASAVYAVFYYFYLSRQIAKMKKYVTAEGTLLSAKMTIYKSRSTDPSHTAQPRYERRFSTPRSRNGTYYIPSMKYTYTVDGREYTSDSVVFGGRVYVSASRAEIERMIDHPVGGPITVFYNPDKPEESFLEKGL